MDNRPIGIFDSGIGGLTVYKEIIKKFPNENIIYVADTKNFPYGNKSKEDIIKFSKYIIDFFISKNVKAIIIACGTATSQALDTLKSIYSIPIIGIIEPTALYIAKKEGIHNVGILATEGSIRSKVWYNSVFNYRPDLNIINKSCPLLASIAEKGLFEDSSTKSIIHEYLQDLHLVDCLILGCTHYPLFENIFKSELSNNVEILNVGTILANFLSSNSIFSTSTKDSFGKLDIYLTKHNYNFINLSKKILSKDINSINIC